MILYLRNRGGGLLVGSTETGLTEHVSGVDTASLAGQRPADAAQATISATWMPSGDSPLVQRMRERNARRMSILRTRGSAA